MRAAISIVLAGLLVTLPIKQVLAQAAQQDSTNAETSLVREQGSQPVIRVPALTPENALLWQPIAENRARILGEPLLSNRDAVSGWSDWSTEKKVLVVVVAIVLVAAAVLYVAGCPKGADGSCQPIGN